MLKQQDDGGNRNLGSKGGEQSRVDIWGSNMFESPRDRAQNPDRIFAFGVDPVTAIKPRGEGKDDHDKGVPQN